MSAQNIGIVALVLLLGACANLPAKVSVDEAIKLSKAGTTPDTIIEQMRESRSTYALTASDILRLYAQGVPPPVLDYMQQTQLELARREAQRHELLLEHSRRYWFGWQNW